MDTLQAGLRLSLNSCNSQQDCHFLSLLDYSGSLGLGQSTGDGFLSLLSIQFSPSPGEHHQLHINLTRQLLMALVVGAWISKGQPQNLQLHFSEVVQTFCA